MNEIEVERKRIKSIVQETLEDEASTKRIHPPSRIPHLISQISFKIDNPDYVRKVAS